MFGNVVNSYASGTVFRRSNIIFPLDNMKRTAVILLLLVAITVICNGKPLEEPTASKQVEKRSIFGLSAFALSLLNGILAISLNTSINRQNAEFGGLVGG